MRTHFPSVVLGGLLASLAAVPAQAQGTAAAEPSTPFTPAHVAAVAWRNLGPANMGGRITDIDVPVGRPATMYVATAGGGLWKTVNAGTTWAALFQDQATVSIGDVAVAPSNPDIVWIGSGEENARNSVQWGDGVYKSTDGGATFRNTGLRETFQIGHIEIHPHDADIVYVAALGRLWSHNPDRGVYRTKDGGKTWQKVLFLDEKTGAIDVRLDPRDPNTVYACAYERMRDGFDGNDPAVRFGARSGLYKSTDGGDTWRRITNGLPTCQWGRSGLSVYAKDPKTLFLIVETERSGWATGEQMTGGRAAQVGGAYMGINGEDGEDGARLTMVTPDGPSATAGLEAGDVIVKLDEEAIANYADLLRTIRAAESGAKVKVTFRRGEEQKETELTYGTREAPEAGGGGLAGAFGGGGSNGPFGGRLGGQQPNVQDQQGDLGFETGGIFRSDDHGETWTRVNSLTDRPFYYSVIAVDPQDDQNVYSCGVPFYASKDGGKTFRPAQGSIHVDFHAVWIDPQDSDHVVVGCDGGLHVTWDRCRTWELVNNFSVGQPYHVAVDSQDPYWVYGGLQDNGTWGGPSRTRWREGIVRDDWVTIYSGDGFGAAVDADDPSQVYATSQNGGLGRVNMRTGSTASVQKPRGVQWNWDTPFFLSPHNQRILYFAGSKACRSFDRGRTSEAISDTLGLTERGTATAFAESPRRAGLLYAGTDDGALWRTTDGGRTWEEIHQKVLGMPGPRYVSSIQPSWHRAERVYVTFEGHRSDDFDTHVYVSEDGGDTWTDLIANLPDEPAHVLREDPRNQDLLFLGTEFACYASLDRGQSWLRLGNGLPTVAVRDLAIQDRDGDLAAATHGQGFFVLDIAPLRQMTAEVGAADAHLFAPEVATLWVMRRMSLLGDKEWRAPNPPDGATIYVFHRDEPPADAKVTVHDIAGEVVATLPLARKSGLQALQWTTRAARGPRAQGAGAVAGNYSVRYRHGERELIQPLVLRDDPAGAVTPLSDPSTSTPPSRN
jgi:photosystem II stability/assembly factor-like uncharacterized protein